MTCILTMKLIATLCVVFVADVVDVPSMPTFQSDCGDQHSTLSKEGMSALKDRKMWTCR